MTISTQLTQGSTTHIKDGLPVTTVSNLGALTQASEELIMQIKATADEALELAEGGGGSSEELEEVKTIANEANARSVSNTVSIDSLTTSLNATNALLDTTVISELDVQQQTTGEYVVSSSATNLKTKDITTSSWELGLASSAKTGLMPKESYQAIDDLQSRVSSLESGGIWRATFATYQALIESYPDLNVSSTDWTVNDYVEVESDSNYDGDPTRYAVVVNGQVKTLVFQKRMQAAVQIATASSTGVVLGSADTAENKYKIFVENDGSMSLIGANNVEANLSVAVPYSSVVGESVSRYKLVEKDGLLFRANSAILEVPAAFEPTAWTQVGGRDTELDGVTISKNVAEELQAIGYVEKNKGEPEYQWTGTYAEWVEGRNNETIPDEWICKITDDYNTDGNRKTFRSILELWWSYSTDDYQDGAYCADGREFYKSDFKSEDESSNPYNKIVAQGRGITYEQYQQTLNTYGFCGAFAVDTVNEKFRLPTIKNCYIRAGESIGETLDQSVPNIVATWNDMGVEDGTGSGAITYKRFDLSRYSHIATIYNTRGGFEFDASKYNSAYKDGADVLPYSVVLKPMIQLINYIPKNVSIDFVANMERAIQELKAAVNTLNAKVVEVSNSFVPDYSNKTAITSGYVTQEKGAFQLNCNSYSSTPHVYFDGVEVWTGCLYGNERAQSNCFLTVKKGVAITWSATNNSSLNAYFIPFETQPEFVAAYFI